MLIHKYNLRKIRDNREQIKAGWEIDNMVEGRYGTITEKRTSKQRIYVDVYCSLFMTNAIL